MDNCTSTNTTLDGNLGLLGGYCIAISYSIIFNILAIIAVIKIYKNELTRTPKLLISLFVTQVLTSLSVCTLYAYQIKDFAKENCNLYRIHIFIIAFSMTWSSVTLTFTSIDRYLLVLRGSIYIKWKRSFPALILSTFIIYCLLVFGINLILLTLRVKSSELITVSLTIFLLLLSGITALFINVYTVIYIRTRLISDTCSRVKYKKRVVSTILSITFSSIFLECVVIALLMAFGHGLIFSTGDSNGVSKFILLAVLIRDGTIPFIYIARSLKFSNTAHL